MVERMIIVMYGRPSGQSFRPGPQPSTDSNYITSWGVSFFFKNWDHGKKVFAIVQLDY